MKAAFKDGKIGIQRASDYKPVSRHLRIGHCDGTAMLVTRELVSKAGMFDPTFSPGYGWGASGDYCIRAKEHGFQVILTEAAYCEHIRASDCEPANRQVICGGVRACAGDRRE